MTTDDPYGLWTPAPDGQVYVCAACGKRSKDRGGNMRIDRGYDESCMLNAVLCYEQKQGGMYVIVEENEDEPSETDTE